MDFSVGLNEVGGDIVFNIFELIRLLQSRNLIKKSKISNLRPNTPNSSTIEINIRSDYRNTFYLFQSFSFEGDFGPDPDVFLIYSLNDEEIEFNRGVQEVSDENLVVTKLSRKFFEKGKYEYALSKQISYYSNNDSKFDIRPFVVVVLGDDSIGFATLTVINKSMILDSSGYGHAVSIPFTGENPFIPQVKFLTWPTEKDLLKKLRDNNTGKVFYLEDGQIEGIMNLKRYFISTLDPKMRAAYSDEYS